MKVAVTGASGFLGSYVTAELDRRGHEALRWSHRPTPGCSAFDLARSDLLSGALETQRPDAIIHLAAISEVGRCNDDPALARRVNVSATGETARLAARYGLRLVHLSTDQIFDGTRGGWREEDEARPLNVYGETKLSGEREVAGACPDAVILRPCLITGIASPGRRSSTSNFLDAMKNGRPQKMFTDEIRSPVAASDVARAAVDFAERPGAGGIFHCGGPEALSRYELACRLAEATGYDKNLISSTTRKEEGMASGRPANLSLDSSRLIETLGWTPRNLAPSDLPG